MHTADTTTLGTNTMTALVQTGFGEPDEVLRVGEVSRPEPGHDGVVVRVRAASVHVGTVYGVRGYPKVMRPMFKKFIAGNGAIGLSMAGVVEAVGPDVIDVAVGDEVVGWASGAFAEFAVTTSDTLVPKPSNLGFEQAAALGVSAFTALQALRDHGDLRPGQHVLVTGASGGVGTFAVQIAKAMGAEVTAVCSTRNLDLVRSIGADHVVDYTQQDWTMGEHTYDLILDNVGGHSLRDMRRVLTPGGLLLANGGPAPRGWFGGIGYPLRVLASSLFSRRQGRPFLATEQPEDLRTLRDMAEAGQITPVIDRAFPLQDAVDAVASVGAGHNRGTSVVTMALDTPQGLVAGAGPEQQLRFSTAAALDQDWIGRLHEVSSVIQDGDQFVVTGDDRMLFSVVSLLAAHDIVPDHLQIDQPPVDDAVATLADRLDTPDGVTR